jgi:microcystin-dependent protein
MASGGIDVTPGRVLGETEEITPDKLNDLGLPVLRVQAGAVTARELADGSISSDKLDVDLEAQLGVADGSVTTNKLADSAVTSAKIEESARLPVGMIIDFAGTVAPTGWLLCYGQAVSRSTFSGLFTVLGVVFGAGDGSTTFNLPDCRGRVAAGKDDMGGSSADRLGNYVSGSVNGDGLGNVGGEEYHTVTTAEMPSHTHTAANHQHTMSHTHGYSIFSLGTPGFTTAPGGQVMGLAAANTTADSLGGVTGFGGAFNVTSTGSSNGHNTVQPTIIFNKIIRY